MLWVTRDGGDDLEDAALRERASVGVGVEVQRKTLRGWDTAQIPAGSRDEWGTVFAEALNVGSNQLPPEGRVYLINRV